MKAIVIDRFGGSDVLELREAATPAVPPGTIRIRTAYASVNPADWKARAGLLPNIRAADLPMTIGFDCSGTVDAIGAGVEGFRPGDRVVTQSGFGLGYQGTYADYCCAPWQRVSHLPVALSLAEGATLPIAGASAASSILDVASVGRGQRAFVNGGSGSVGTFAVQLLRRLGLEVSASCSTRNVAYVGGLGADPVIDYTREDIVARLTQWAPGGVDLILDTVGQNSLPRDMPLAVAEGGMLIVVTNLLTGIEAFDVEAASRRNVAVVDNVTGARTADPFDFQMKAFRTLLNLVETGAITVPPYEIVPAERAGEAQDRVREGHVRGKLLLAFDGG